MEKRNFVTSYRTPSARRDKEASDASFDAEEEFDRLLKQSSAPDEKDEKSDREHFGRA